MVAEHILLVYYLCFLHVYFANADMGNLTTALGQQQHDFILRSVKLITFYNIIILKDRPIRTQNAVTF